MDTFIASSKDVHLLRKKEILGNWLSVEDAFNFFENLYSDTFVVDFCHGRLYAELNKYTNIEGTKVPSKIVLKAFPKCLRSVIKISKENRYPQWFYI